MRIRSLAGVDRPWGQGNKDRVGGLVETVNRQEESGAGLWSRSAIFRIIAWIVVIQGALILSLFVSAFLSGYGSVIDMINSLRLSIGV